MSADQRCVRRLHRELDELTAGNLARTRAAMLLFGLDADKDKLRRVLATMRQRIDEGKL